jgi:hypothetical protein
MTWLSDIWDWGSNQDWDQIGKVVNTGRNIINAFDVNSSRQGVRSDMLDAYTKMSAADQEYQRQMMEYQQQQAGARAAAARQNDLARRKAAKEALKVQKKYLTELAANYQPYADAVKTLTPKAADNYGKFLDTTALLNQYLAPTVSQSLSQAPQPTWSKEVPLNAYSVPTINAAEMSFPSLEDLLKGGR